MKRIPIKHAVSIIIINEKGQTLFVLRSKKKKSYPLTWSLPSAFIQKNETTSEAVKRIGREKLNVELKNIRLAIEGKKNRGDYILFMHDYFANLKSGEPKIISDDYIKLKWEEPFKQFSEIKVMGECIRLYKKYLDHAY